MADPALLRIDRQPTAAVLAGLDALCFGSPISGSLMLDSRESPDGFLSDVWDEEFYRSLLASSHGFGLVLASEAEGPVGFLCYRRLGDEAELYRIGVLPGTRRKGQGRRLMEIFREELELADADGVRVRWVRLEVREGNGAARALYRSLGFKEAGRRKGYYSGHSRAPAEDAVLYLRDLQD